MSGKKVKSWDAAWKLRQQECIAAPATDCSKQQQTVSEKFAHNNLRFHFMFARMFYILPVLFLILIGL